MMTCSMERPAIIHSPSFIHAARRSLFIILQTHREGNEEQNKVYVEEVLW